MGRGGVQTLTGSETRAGGWEGCRALEMHQSGQPRWMFFSWGASSAPNVTEHLSDGHFRKGHPNFQKDPREQALQELGERSQSVCLGVRVHEPQSGPGRGWEEGVQCTRGGARAARGRPPPGSPAPNRPRAPSSPPGDHDPGPDPDPDCGRTHSPSPPRPPPRAPARLPHPPRPADARPSRRRRRHH